MQTLLTALACGVIGGICGSLFEYLTRPRGRRRGGHRPWWRRARRTDPYDTTDVPLQGLDLTTDDAPTAQIPRPGEGVDHSQGEQ